jgi:threonine dehydrogenase-like Zn-dependent dehydrogenase
MIWPLTVDASLLDRDLTMTVGRRELPEPGAEEALIAVEWAGVCGSDLHVMRTGAWVVDWPATLGHELYGRIVQAPPGSLLAAGTPVVADSRVPCGRCDECRRDRNRCPNIQFVGEVRPGGFASHCVLPLSLLHPVAEHVPGSTAVLAEPLAVAVHALSHLHHQPERIAILGHGPIGALIHIEARRLWPGCTVDVAEPATLRRELAETLGANAFESDGELTAGGYDTVIDAAGYRSSMNRALELGDVGAHVLLVALGHTDATVTPSVLVERRLQITGCHAFIDELPTAVALLTEEGSRYAPVVTETVGLADLPDAVARQLRRPDAVKLLVRP